MTGEKTVFIYDAFGKMIAEYSTRVESPSLAKVSYLTFDHLGSPRITTDKNGKVASRRDFMPFGEELTTANSPERSVNNGYAEDGIRRKFTSYERDDETGIDFARARYYKQRLGRFTSADPLLESASPSAPQSWNRYTYTSNNPLNYIDPTGLAALDEFFINRDGSYVIVENDDAGHNYYIETDDGSGEYRFLARLEENDAGLVQFPGRMDFFDRYGTVDAGGTDSVAGETAGQGDHFVRPIVAAGLFGIAAVMRDAHGVTVSFGDMSSANGSDPWEPSLRDRPNRGHHAGHGHLGNRSGLDADFRYIGRDGRSFQSGNAAADPRFSRENNQLLYDTAAGFGFTANYQGTNGRIRGVTKASGHKDHGHLGFSGRSARASRARSVIVNGGRGTYRPGY